MSVIFFSEWRPDLLFLKKAFLKQPHHQGVFEGINQHLIFGKRHYSIAALFAVVTATFFLMIEPRKHLKIFSSLLCFISLIGVGLANNIITQLTILLCPLMVFILLPRGKVNISMPSLRKYILRATVNRVIFMLGVVCLTLSLFSVIESGKSRYKMIYHSVEVSLIDVFSEDYLANNKPYFSKDYWQRPLTAEDTIECMDSETYRCAIDQSIYLRVSWLLVYLRSHLNAQDLENLQAIRKSQEQSPSMYFKNVDNLSLDILVKSGWLGYVAFLSLIIFLLLTFRRENSSSSNAVGLATAILLQILLCSLLLRGYIGKLDGNLIILLFFLLGLNVSVTNLNSRPKIEF